MNEMLNVAYAYVVANGLNILAALAIFVIGRWLAGLVTRWIEAIVKRTKVDPTLIPFIKQVSHFALMVVVLIATLNKLGVQTASLIAALSACLLTIGLALQGSLSNFAAGVMLLLFKPFKVGDFISGGGTMGTVVEIQLFNTVLNGPDNRREIVPNAKLTSDAITNFSAIERRRIDLVFGISYDDDIKVAKDTLLKIVTEDERILKDPAPVVAVKELGDSSVNLVCRPWVKPTDYWDVYFSVVEKGKIELEKAGCSIPYPQRDVHMFQE